MSYFLRSQQITIRVVTRITKNAIELIVRAISSILF